MVSHEVDYSTIHHNSLSPSLCIWNVLLDSMISWESPNMRATHTNSGFDDNFNLPCPTQLAFGSATNEVCIFILFIGAIY